MKRKTNIECINDLMEYSKYGALAQIFVIDALTKFSKAVSEAKPEDVAGAAFISPEAWIGVAKEIHTKLTEHLGPEQRAYVDEEDES